MEDKQMEILERVLEKHGKPKMLPNPMPSYNHKASRHPDQLRVCFDDGSTAVYDLRAKQPAPQIVENIRIIRKWKQKRA